METRARIIRLMKEAMESIPNARDFIKTTLSDAEAFLNNFEPPSVGNRIEDLRRIATQLCMLDAMTRVADSAETKEACSAVATKVLLRHSWRMKDGAAARASDLNHMSTKELDEWAAPYLQRVDELRASMPKISIH